MVMPYKHHATLTAQIRRYLMFRRVFEVLVVLPALIVLLPIFVIIAAIIFIDTKSNPFFVQKRPGLNGKFFSLLKFKTMIAQSKDATFELTKDEDPRITKSGKFLRDYHLDELPQLINVLLGDMSLVGPRPLPGELYEKYKANIPNYDQRHIIKPGITGFSQVWLGYITTLKGEALRWKYDMVYLDEISLKQDLNLLYQTIFLNTSRKERLQYRTLQHVQSWHTPKVYKFKTSGSLIPSFSTKSISLAS